MTQSTMLSTIDCGDIMCTHAAATTLKPLDTAYHSTLCFITADSYRIHHCDLYKKVGWHWHWQLKDIYTPASSSIRPRYSNYQDT